MKESKVEDKTADWKTALNNNDNAIMQPSEPESDIIAALNSSNLMKESIPSETEVDDIPMAPEPNDRYVRKTF